MENFETNFTFFIGDMAVFFVMEVMLAVFVMADENGFDWLAFISKKNIATKQ